MGENERKNIFSLIVVTFLIWFVVVAAVDAGAPESIENAVRDVGQRIGLIP